MDLLLILTYTAFCVVIFKAFKIPLNKWSVPTAVLGGVIMIGTLVLFMNYNHPYSEISRQYFVTTPIVPTSSGKVTEVAVSGNMEVKKGDVLFKVDPTPYQNKVNSLNARLVSAQADKDRAEELVKRKVGNQRDLDNASALVDDLRGQLAIAQFDLDGTTVLAPTDGYATQVALRPGMMAVSLPLRPVMVFVHKEEHYFVGWFRQNSLMRLKAGYEAEVAFDGLPGKVFTGEVKLVMPALSEGQIAPSGNLINSRTAPYPGRVPVVIEISDERFAEYAEQIPGGAYGQSAVYSDHAHHVAIMRKILLRMSSWMNYLFPFH